MEMAWALTDAIERVGFMCESVGGQQEDEYELCADVLLSSREHLPSWMVYSVLNEGQATIEHLIKKRAKGRSRKGWSQEDWAAVPPIPSWTNVVNKVIQGSLNTRQDYPDILKFIVNGQYGSPVFPIPPLLLSQIYEMSDHLGVGPMLTACRKLLQRCNPPAQGDRTLRFAEYISGISSHQTPYILALDQALEAFPTKLSGAQWAEYLVIRLHMYSFNQVRRLYDAVVELPRIGKELAADPQLVLVCIRDYGSPHKPGGEMRDLEFAKRVIREFAHASTPLDEMQRDDMRALAKAFMAVGAPKAAFRVFDFIRKAEEPPTEMDVAECLCCVLQSDPAKGATLLDLAVRKKAITSAEAVETVLDGTRDIEDAAVVERIKQSCQSVGLPRRIARTRTIGRSETPQRRHRTTLRVDRRRI